MAAIVDEVERKQWLPLLMVRQIPFVFPQWPCSWLLSSIRRDSSGAPTDGLVFRSVRLRRPTNVNIFFFFYSSFAS